MRVAIAVAVFVAVHVMAGDISAALINEFHYDNSGTDTDEFVELLLSPGENISDFSVHLYSGHNGGTYQAVAGSDFVFGDANAEGFQVFQFTGPTNFLQNGAPDGFALVSGDEGDKQVVVSGGVLQFLSYEGVFTATDGPAAGMESTDVGASETSSTPTGSSLALIGTGQTYSDFTWSDPAPATPGAFNTGQVATATAVPEPGSAAVLVGLAAAAGLRRWRQRRGRSQPD